ncbi:hypothetical protein REC12_15490 [Desulfosporosinus sp. PR]|uniref:hypothetical protein n=1 Tax=Candidatus Desulfosporosinus nitrosoreducens TaxID=3401928 RepID=UPI0027F3F7BF|nr:hypothetical protein [Desulfosporosinus sp. PR]MDQ7094999.1 hypothetical protein [Desulfosporosinus sp. PR]
MFLVEADCTFLGKSTYPRANNQIGTQIHLLSGMETVKVACEPVLFESTPAEGAKCHVKLDFMATKKGNFLKAIEIKAIPPKL